MNTPDFYKTIIAIAGPSRELEKIQSAKMMRGDVMGGSGYDQILKFPVADDHGEFPDTSGYTRADFENMSLANEDPALFGVMQKCMDAVIEHNEDAARIADKLGLVNIEISTNWPRKGGKMFFAAGFVSAHKPASPLATGIKIAPSGFVDAINSVQFD